MRHLQVLLAGFMVLVAACTPAAPSPTAAPAKPPPTESKPAAKTEPAAPAAPAAAPAAPAAAKPAAPADAKPAATANQQFQELLAAAKRENKLTLFVNTPNEPTTHKALFEAFKKRFDIDPQWEWLPLIGPEANARVVSEGRAGQGSADIVYGSYANVVQVADAGFLPEFDWVGVFGQELPGIKAVVDEAIPEFRNKALPHWDVIYVAMYTKGELQPDAVPNRIEDFTQPQWRGKFIIPGANHPWQMLGLELGADPMFELMKRVLDNQPVIARQPPAAVAAQVAGQAPFGIGYTSALETEIKKGANIDWKPFQDYVPADPLPIYVPSTAPHPNLARLFAAWLVTEGLKIEQEMEYIGRVTDTEGAVGKKIKQMAPNAKVLRATNLKEVQTMEAMRGRIGELITAASR